MLTLFSFLGGSAFRLIFGGVMDWLNKQQDHKHELQSLELQSRLDAERHQRSMDSIRLQSDLKVGEIKIAGGVMLEGKQMDAFLEAVKGTRVVTGVHWVDALNAVIRPAGAVISLALWIFAVAVAFSVADAAMIKAGTVLTEFDRTLISAFLGVFVGDRIHSNMKR